ncbi:hypothetical protein GXW82_14325 [Streptacidiphilus sp. 4-A2]|nr:hypothetical protein [Streptacidiphilus sp. 4-A2]
MGTEFAERLGRATVQARLGGPAYGHQVYRTLAQECERESGPGHRDTLQARQLALVELAQSGRPARAAEEAEGLLHDAGAHLGADDPLTVSVAGMRANWTGLAGDPRRAAQLYGAIVDTLPDPDAPGAPAGRPNAGP